MADVFDCPDDKDKELIKRAMEGDESALNLLMQKYSSQIYTRVDKTLSDNRHTDQDAEEVTSDIVHRVYRKISTLKNPAKFPGWLCKTTKNICIDWQKQNKKRLQCEQPLDDKSSKVYEEAANNKREILDSIVAELPATLQVPVILYYYMEKSCEEIAKFLGLSLNTIHQQLCRARKEIKQRHARRQAEETKDYHEKVDSTFASLPREDRLIWMLYYDREKSCEDIAGFLDDTSTDDIEECLSRVQKQCKERSTIIKKTLRGLLLPWMQDIMRQLPRGLLNSAPKISKPIVPWIATASLTVVTPLIILGIIKIVTFQLPYRSNDNGKPWAQLNNGLTESPEKSTFSLTFNGTFMGEFDVWITGPGTDSRFNNPTTQLWIEMVPRLVSQSSLSIRDNPSGRPFVLHSLLCNTHRPGGYSESFPAYQ